MKLTIRVLMDGAAVMADFCAVYAATGSLCCALAGGTAAGAYGLWCFFDGATPG